MAPVTSRRNNIYSECLLAQFWLTLGIRKFNATYSEFYNMNSNLGEAQSSKQIGRPVAILHACEVCEVSCHLKTPLYSCRTSAYLYMQ